MKYTSDDIKDILKKVLGTLIAAVLITAASSIYEVLSPLLLTLILCVAAALILFFLWRFGKMERKEEAAAGPVTELSENEVKELQKLEKKEIKAKVKADKKSKN
jgi:hypothetical protein